MLRFLRALGLIIAGLALARIAVTTPSVQAQSVQASGKRILIYGPSLYDPVSVVTEKTLAEAAGHTVTVVDAATWSSMTTADFQAYDAIVIGELRGEWWTFWYGWWSWIWWLPG